MRTLFDAKKEYTLQDLDCKYCLYHKTDHIVCCCAEEKRAALKREQADPKPLPRQRS